MLVLPATVHPIMMGVTWSTGHLKSFGYEGFGEPSTGGTLSDQVTPVTAVRSVFLLIEAVAYGQRDIIFYASVVLQ